MALQLWRSACLQASLAQMCINDARVDGLLLDGRALSGSGPDVI